ncbi:MAG: hypothetical protein IPI15_17185 [Saprospiraceae bacterium]|uniref:hypothetical protein n=1 Tax=Candidatus Brachybacter algidus TaxID=2982024 RepID=UPI00257F09E6|nr:hypothetical protein [Candidatus Brachybacter algidus]MBK7605270.1 hypothetical protein [Candidatus Brachybacter algidus]
MQTCDNGSITVIATGGTMLYEYYQRWRANWQSSNLFMLYRPDPILWLSEITMDVKQYLIS